MNGNEQLIRCIERVYEIRRGSKITIVRTRKPMTEEATQQLLGIDSRLDELLNDYDIISLRIVVPVEKKGDGIRIIPEEKTIIALPDDKLPAEVSEKAQLPGMKERLWSILHELPGDEITQDMWIRLLVSRKYNKQQAKNNVCHDFTKLMKMGKIERIEGRKGRYKVIDRGIYKDDKEFSKKMETLASGGKLTLGV